MPEIPNKQPLPTGPETDDVTGIEQTKKAADRAIDEADDLGARADKIFTVVDGAVRGGKLKNPKKIMQELDGLRADLTTMRERIKQLRGQSDQITAPLERLQAGIKKGEELRARIEEMEQKEQEGLDTIRQSRARMALGSTAEWNKHVERTSRTLMLCDTLECDPRQRGEFKDLYARFDKLRRTYNGHHQERQDEWKTDQTLYRTNAVGHVSEMMRLTEEMQEVADEYNERTGGKAEKIRDGQIQRANLYLQNRNERARINQEIQVQFDRLKSVRAVAAQHEDDEQLVAIAENCEAAIRLYGNHKLGSTPEESARALIAVENLRGNLDAFTAYCGAHGIKTETPAAAPAPAPAPAPARRETVTPAPRQQTNPSPAPRTQPRTAPAPAQQPKAVPAPRVGPSPAPRQQPVQPSRPAEAPPELVDDLTLEGGRIRIPGGTTYVAYELDNGAGKLQQYIALRPDLIRSSMPGRFNAEHIRSGGRDEWVVTPAPGLRGTFFVRHGGKDIFIDVRNNTVRFADASSSERSAASVARPETKQPEPAVKTSESAETEPEKTEEKKPAAAEPEVKKPEPVRAEPEKTEEKKTEEKPAEPRTQPVLPDRVVGVPSGETPRSEASPITDVMARKFDPTAIMQMFGGAAMAGKGVEAVYPTMPPEEKEDTGAIDPDLQQPSVQPDPAAEPMPESRLTETEPVVEKAKYKPGVYELENEQDLWDAIASGEPILVKLGADWCGPCRTLDGQLENSNLAKAYHVIKVNIDRFPNIKQQFGVAGVPHRQWFYKGQKYGTPKIGIMQAGEDVVNSQNEAQPNVLRRTSMTEIRTEQPQAQPQQNPVQRATYRPPQRKGFFRRIFRRG